MLEGKRGASGPLGDLFGSTASVHLRPRPACRRGVGLPCALRASSAAPSTLQHILFSSCSVQQSIVTVFSKPYAS